MRILVPTDFSQLSKVAVDYALELCKDFELEMTLFHVISTNTPAMARISSKKLEETIKASTNKEMERLLQSIKENAPHALNINSEIVYNASIAKAVESFASKHNIDLICIGTKGATGLKKLLFGSNAAGIVSNSSIPVLTIPEDAVYKGVDSIVYSCDLENLEEELKRLVPFAKAMKAWIHVLHIDTGDTEGENLTDREDRLKSQLSIQELKTKTIVNDTVIDGINQYVSDVDADMLAMFTRSTSLFKKIFNPSTTKREAFQTKTPLLSFQKA